MIRQGVRVLIVDDSASVRQILSTILSEDPGIEIMGTASDPYAAARRLQTDLPDVKPEDLDIRIENNVLTIRGERKFEKKVSEDKYLRVERAYGSFSRSFSLASTVNTEAIKADYKDGVLTLTIPKREEAKPKQIKVQVGTAQAAAAGTR